MQGRWTIRKWSGGSEVLGPLTIGEGYQSNGDVPVVPCDDAAIERAHSAMRACAGRYLTDRQIVDLVLRAAGETP